MGGGIEGITMLHMFFSLSTAQANWGPFPIDQEEYNITEEMVAPAPCSKLKLVDGKQLPQSKNYRIINTEKVWGTPQMIEALTIATEEVAWFAPHAQPLVIGDISKRGGGKLKGHRSHRGGSDADIGIYRGNGEQSPYGLKTVSPNDFDAKTNWLLIRALFDSGEVERILIDQKLVDKLRKYVIEEGELSTSEANYMFPSKMKKTIWLRDKVVHHHPGHKHHFHIRTYCKPTIN